MNIPVYVGVLIMAVLFFVAYLLHLPEGGPRFAAFGLITLVGVAMVVMSVRYQNRGK